MVEFASSHATTKDMNSFESWMKQQGLSESSVKKYSSAVSGPLTSWANANTLFNGSLTDIEELMVFDELSSSIRNLPIFIERNTTGHGMYSAALIKFAEYLKLGNPSREQALLGEAIYPRSVSPHEAWSNTARRMVKTAQQTANASNGQEVLQTIKNKHNAFPSLEVFSQHVAELMERQKFCCAITGIPLHSDDLPSGDDEMRASLDRIDSNGHYEPDNLQVVCKFINRWKGAGQNAQFLSLMGTLRQHWGEGPVKKLI